MSEFQPYKKGRGAQYNPTNRFLKNEIGEWFDDIKEENERFENKKTEYIEVFPKTIVNYNKSPDVPDYSMNPYQGCEHGCIYCFARNTHEYWGYSAGTDFEQKILVKKNAPELLSKKLSSKTWKAHSIMLSGNTDCYQPIERKLGITRDILSVFLRHQHPVGIITKNSLITRDLDLLKKLNDKRLVSVVISFTSLNEDTRRILEPRTSSVKQKLKTIKTLGELRIPVTVLMGPIIPAINSHEIIKIAQTTSAYGANYFGYTLVRLNGQIGDIFTDWVKKTYPDRAEKILNQIKNCHGGNLNDSRFDTRMRGEGEIAKSIRDTVKLAQNKFFKTKKDFRLNTDAYIKNPNNHQFKLF